MGSRSAKRPQSHGPWTPTPVLPPEVWFLVLVGALDARWHFAARAVCRAWRDMVDGTSSRGRAVVYASSVTAWHSCAQPRDLVAFCLASAGHMREGASARPLCRRDVLLALVASGDRALVDYALDDLAQCLAVRGVSPTGHMHSGGDGTSRTHRGADVRFDDDTQDDNNYVQDGNQCDLDRGHGHTHRGNQGDRRHRRQHRRGSAHDEDNAADGAFYRRATGVALRVGGMDLLQRLAQCIPEFDALRHVDPADAISVDCVAALTLIDPPSGAFRREGYAIALRAHAVPAVWYEAGRADAVAIVERLLDDATESDALAAVAHADDRAGNTDLPVRCARAPSALQGPCPAAAARAAAVHGNVRVLDVLAARPEVRAVATARGLNDLARRAAAACSARGFAWCRSALARIGADVDVVAAASDAVMGPWIENAPRVAWNTDAAVRFLDWLSRAEGGATLATAAAAAEIVRCTGHPRRFPADAGREGDTAQHARAIAAFFLSLSPGPSLDETPPAPARE
ncbi:F-box incomplete domain containing protein [Pandoravirus japonicus]|uniref:F-box incomplete domain containing protein n=1 Tax=Pandoravirus japonicus TaxID=2823154 RepID=A0A811BTL1_9VIRU|nr:F-box incomplete domain containing protein [Pandoravirus japonicus]